MQRRTFLLAAGTAGAALGANDRVSIAVAGLGGRGRDHVTEYAKLPDCEITAICDINQAALERGQAQVERLTGKKPKGYSDLRKLFDDKSIDAVSMPLPNHWHALATIWACQAGKDVYIEKPASHNIYEGQQMVAAARKYGRMVQVGSQSRSMPHKMQAVKLLHEGVIGKIHTAKGICFKRRPSIGHKPDTPTPPGVDWNLFLGPAPLRPFNELRFAYNWHWFWDTGNGDIGNQGVHEMDVARWGLNVGLPRNVVSTGGKLVYNDDQETPNTQLATFDYGDKQLVFEVRGLPTGPEAGLPMVGNNCIGNAFYGSDGWLAMDHQGFKVYKGDKSEVAMDVKATGPLWDTGAHMSNFLKGIKSRKYQDLNADIEIGAASAAMCHLANISYRMGRRLEFDGASQRFPKDAEANRMLTRNYRAPYVVPEKV